MKMKSKMNSAIFRILPRWTLILLIAVLVCPNVSAQLHRATKSSVEVSDTKTFVVKGVSFNMISIQSEDRKSYFYLGETEVTQELWEAVMGSNPSKNKKDGKQKPVEQVSIQECEAFIKKLNSLTGATFKIPNIKDWLYASSGGNHSEHYKYSGSDNLDDVAWLKDNSKGATHNVKTKRPNELGLYDMHGNVEEFCSTEGWDPTKTKEYQEQTKKMDPLVAKMMASMSKTKNKL